MRRASTAATEPEPADALQVEISDPRWHAFVANHDDAGPFHDPAWAAMLAECYRFRSGALALLDRDGRIESGLPVLEVGRRSRRRWVSVSFTDFCPPLTRRDADAASVARRLDELRRGASVRSLEVRGELGGALGWAVPRGYRHTLALAPEPRAVYASFHQSRVRGAIKRAASDGVVVRRARSYAEFEEGFWELHVATRRRLGVPVQPRRFFELLWRRLIEPGNGLVLVAVRGARPVAAGVFLTANHRLVYKFSASDRAQVGATHSVLWEAVQWGCRNGFAELDFGRTDAENHGLRAFKLGWGAEELPLRYTFLADRPPAASAPRALGAAGVVIRHSPSWFARAVGLVAYRRTA